MEEMCLVSLKTQNHSFHQALSVNIKKTRYLPCFFYVILKDNFYKSDFIISEIVIPSASAL
jgi:hypothetical protein